MSLRVEPFARAYPSEHVQAQYLKERRTVVLSLAASPRPCVTRSVLDGLRVASEWIRALNAGSAEAVRHMILASRHPGVFSLGGDLDLFVQCIQTGDRATLRAYALDCVRIGHVFHTGFEGTVSTTAVIAGQAMGGGLEGAACCQTILVEKGSTLQLPEIKFGMFPGMGAISYLSRRVPGVIVRRLVEEGEAIDLEEAFAIRMIDGLTERGAGLDAAHGVNARLDGAFHAHLATRHAFARAQGPSLGELEAIAADWVEVAFKVGLRDLRLMSRLAAQQLRLPVDRSPRHPRLPIPVPSGTPARPSPGPVMPREVQLI